MPDLARCLRRLVVTADPESDGDLLGRFVATRDEQAFAELVRRHGPMVFAVCRRVLGHRHDAEDAFQATFLVLARRAGSLRSRSALGSWLYSVAYRTALGARRVGLARKAREARAGAMLESETTLDSSRSADLLVALDRELAALPEMYRAAVVACELEGLSRRDAASRLGVSEGTLSSRLARARSLLARRLKQSGLVVPAAGLAGIIGPTAVAKSLAESTIRLGTLVAAGEAAASASVAALMEGTMKAMLLAKLKTTATALVVGCAVLVTATAGWQANAAGVADQPGATKPADPPRKAARDADKDRIKELERERDTLRKELSELRDRLAKVEYARLAAEAKAALEKKAELSAAKARARELAEHRALEAAKVKANKTPPKPGSTGLPWSPPPRLEGAAAAPTTPATGSPPPPARTPDTIPPSPVVRPGIPEPAGSPAPATEGTPEGAAGSLPLAGSSRPEPAPSPAGKLGGTIPRLEPPPPAPAKAATSVQVYRVGDLVTDDKDGEALVKVVKAVVESQSWGAGGGVEYLPGRKVLVVRQTDKGQVEVAKLLEMLKMTGEHAPRK